MFKHIMVPVDMQLPAPVAKALDVAVDLAKLHGSRVTLVNVTGRHIHETQDGKALSDALDTLADKLSAKTGGTVEAMAVFSVDVGAEIDSILSRTAKELEADLVVMGAHMPQLLDYVFSSHASHLVQHTAASVFVVR